MSTLRSASLLTSKVSFFLQKRSLNLLEYQSKNLLREHGVAVQNFVVVDQKTNLNELEKFRCNEYVLKAQILAGGRGKGYFDNGLNGGIKVAKDLEEIKLIANKMLGHKLITKQTPKEGIEVKEIMVTDCIKIIKETYISIILDRKHDGPVLIASPEGGVDIESIAEKSSNLIKYYVIDIIEGVTNEKALEIAKFLQFSKSSQQKAAEEIQKLWHFFQNADCTQIEINPFAESEDGRIISVDAKLNFDDNAKFRQPKIFASQDQSESDPREVEASKHNLNYIGMDGNIGCLVNGAGLAMATMDLIKLHGGEPANFLDVGGTVKEEQVRAAITIITSDPKVQSVLINIFGGIVNCSIIAQGIIGALKTIPLKVPLVVRLAGNNASNAKKMLKESNLPIITADGFDEAAIKAVKSIN